MRDPYLVVGTGRSGTSTVAGILHNDMDIFMGHEFVSANYTNPDGFWEDLEFYEPNTAFIVGAINFAEWKKEIAAIISVRWEMDKSWGFKESKIAVLLGFYLGFFKNPKIIRCERKKELVISSLMRCYEHSKKKATAFWHTRETLLDNTLSGKDCLTIHFGEDRVSDTEIIDSIEKKWTNKK